MLVAMVYQPGYANELLIMKTHTIVVITIFTNRQAYSYIDKQVSHHTTPLDV